MSDSDKRCGTCRYWHRQTLKIHNPEFGRCGACDYGSESEDDPECLMYVVDVEGYGATFTTRENFGCKSWEKPDE